MKKRENPLREEDSQPCVCYKLSMSIMLTIFDVSIKEKSVYGSLIFELLPQQMSQSKKKYMTLCQHANKYKQVVMETIS